MSVDTARYLDMERSFYADLVKRSNFDNEAFTCADTSELVVGSYAQHERFDYERWLLGGVHLHPAADALEYGCGPGRMLLRLAPRFRRVDGIDISDDILAVARRRCAKLPVQPRLFLTDGQAVPEKCEGLYDLAFSVICLQHICVYTVRRRILGGLFRALKPGGLLTFQMGYGPGHARMIDYFADFIDAPGANGAADVGVVHPAEVAGDLADLGFASMAYVLTPSGPGDSHGAWIFVRAMKPGPSSATLAAAMDDWRAHGFVPLLPDVTAGARARQLHHDHGILAELRAKESAVTALQNTLTEEQARQTGALAERVADRERACAALEGQRAQLQDALAMARAEHEQLRRRVEIDEKQLGRLRVADRGRLAALIDDLARSASAANLRIGVFGAGAHSESLLRETPLASIADLFVFDSNLSRAGTSVLGHPVRPVGAIPGMRLDGIVVSSLAFQEEMVAFLESLPIPGTRIVRCYP